MEEEREAQCVEEKDARVGGHGLLPSIAICFRSVTSGSLPPGLVCLVLIYISGLDLTKTRQASSRQSSNHGLPHV